MLWPRITTTLQNQANNGWKWQHIHVSRSALLSPYKPERQSYCAIMLHVIASFGTRFGMLVVHVKLEPPIDRNARSPQQRAPLNYCASRMQDVHWSGAVTDYGLQNSVWSWSLRRGAMARDWSLSVMVVKQWGKTTLKSLDDICNRANAHWDDQEQKVSPDLRSYNEKHAGRLPIPGTKHCQMLSVWHSGRSNVLVHVT